MLPNLSTEPSYYFHDKESNSSKEKQFSKNDQTLIKIYGIKDHWISANDLGLQSKVFKRMLSRDWKESTTYELKIGNGNIENGEVIEQFIQWLETKNIQCIKAENYQELLALACEYEVTWLIKDCERFIASNLALDNVLPVIRDIAEPNHLLDLLEECFVHLCKNKD